MHPTVLLFMGWVIALSALSAAHRGTFFQNPAVWLALLSAVVALLARQGLFLDEMRTPPPLLGVGLAGLAWMLVTLRYGRPEPGIGGVRALLAVSLARLPVEYMLHRLADQGMVPEQMTWSGTNFDILAGLAALVLLVMSFFGRLPVWALRAFAIGGLVLLANVMVTGMLSAPTPFQQLNKEWPNKAVLLYPYVLLVAAIVPAVAYSMIRLLLVRRHDLQTLWREEPTTEDFMV